MNADQQIFAHLAVALAIGLLIGTERGWRYRDAEEGQRVAGVRTYGLIGLLGGVVALVAQQFGALVIGLTFLGLVGVLAAVYVINRDRHSSDAGITSLITGLLTFVLGVLAASGEIAVATATAVITTLILSYKPQLHHWLSVLEDKELKAGLKLLLISVVLLPVLPNQGYGPWQALNPYAIWWMVVLVATLSFIGYFSVKLGGTRRGVVFTGIFGGLASSTALTLHFSRLAKQDKDTARVLAVGVLLACGTMIPRMLLLASLINLALLKILIWPALLMAALVYLPALLFWRSVARVDKDLSTPLKNPLELGTALVFGLILAVVMFLGKALQNWFGDFGVLALATASGLTDVDAITLSLSRMSTEDLTHRIACVGIIIAAAANNLTKGAMATAIGGHTMGLRVGLPLLASSLGGLLLALLLIWQQ